MATNASNADGSFTVINYKVPAEIEQKILTAIELKKELEAYESEIKEQLTKAMIDHDIVTIDNDRYRVTLASRTSYSLFGDIKDVPKDLKKTVLNTTKISAVDKLYGELPPSIIRNKTQYIVWKAK